MSKWLASVQSVAEAQSLITVLPDILDMKDPAKGALGALSVETVTEIVNFIDRRCLTSATIGDLAMDPQLIKTKMEEMASSGVDYVKIGLFPDQHLIPCLTELEQTVKSLNVPVIAVIFADKPLNIDYIPLLTRSGFYGLMVDTAMKNGKHLLDNWTMEQLSSFVEQVKNNNLLCGLAGALRIEDIEGLQQLNADYLGFRSALCEQRQRTSTLQVGLAKQIQRAIC